jgi:hypothetical protein
MTGSASANKGAQALQDHVKNTSVKHAAARRAGSTQGLPHADFAYILDSYFLRKNMPDT